MALCTVADVESHYFMSDSGTTPTLSSGVNSLIEDLIDQVTQIFETICGRTFASTEYTEYYSGNGTQYLYPDNYPITSVSGIWDDLSWDWDTSTLATASNYRIMDERAIIYKPGYVFYDYDQNVKIIYTAGYATAGIPKDLKLACIQEVVRMWKSRKDIDITSESQTDGSITRTSKELLPITMETLNRYIRKVII